jgi:hypothetical protein
VAGGVACGGGGWLMLDTNRGWLTENVSDPSELARLAEKHQGAVRYHVCKVCGLERPGVTMVSFKHGGYRGGRLELAACPSCRDSARSRA